MGWRRIVILTVLATSFGILCDRLGVIDAIDRALP